MGGDHDVELLYSGGGCARDVGFSATGHRQECEGQFGDEQCLHAEQCGECGGESTDVGEHAAYAGQGVDECGDKLDASLQHEGSGF